MKRWLLSLIVLALTLSVLTAKGKTMSIENFEKEVLRLTNVERTRHSLRALTYDSGLATLASYHSHNMLRNNFFSHQDPQGYEVSDRQKQFYSPLVVSCIGENIGRFRNSTGTFIPRDLVAGWMNSPVHKGNILNPDYTHLGVGIATRGGVMYATQNFAAPLVKLKTNLPKDLATGKGYRVNFEYMSPIERDRLGCTLVYPDPSKVYKITKDLEMIGAQPLKIEWISQTSFDVLIPLAAGTGNYKVCFGFDGGYFPEGIVLKVD